ncbi:proton-coupled folate transporter isoform X1 [Parasteatoda tepidariorum]|uniref:proton-coupled folate transporter isoform X1 n=1 Tax=Parasteatoda tepidariorum TaxID=114398 RepID=UPI001C720BB8|nr:proton-coupled folate transporter isoform X1 [Parasteatoda tepidariorum]
MDKSPPITNPIIPSSEAKPSWTKSKTGESQIQYGSIQDDVPLIGYESTNRCSRCLRFLTTLTIEPAMFLFMFGFMINMSCLSNLIMDKACLYYYNYTEELCNNISFYPIEKTNLEKLSNNYMLYSQVLSLIAALVMIFIAPWSDRYGRKIPLIAACIGTILSDVGTLLWVIYFESDIAYCILLRLPSEITGGFICFLTIVYSHVADVTSEKNRTMKYTTVEIAMMLALSVGGLAGGELLEYYGYFYVYLTGTIFHVLAALWVVFVLEETVGVGEVVPWKDKRRNFFRSDSISRSWLASVKPRENKGRAKIWMYFLSMCIVILTYEVFGTLGFTYAHHIYNWNPSKYNIVNTSFSLTQFLLMFFIVPLFLKVFKFSDPVLGIYGTISMMTKNFLLAFAKYKVLVYYLGTAAGILSGFTNLAIRTGLSKIVDKEEIG